MTLEKVAALRQRLKPATVRVWHLVPLLGGALLATMVAVLAVDSLGGGRGAQVAFAVLAFIGVLLLAFWDEKIGIVEGLGVSAALIVLVTALVGGLILVGSIEPEPPLGCVSSDGAIQATVSEENTSIYPKADHASTPTGLLLEGCTIHFDDYCIGAVQTDAQYSGVRDSRWLILSEDEMVGQRAYRRVNLTRAGSVHLCGRKTAAGSPQPQRCHPVGGGTNRARRHRPPRRGGRLRPPAGQRPMASPGLGPQPEQRRTRTGSGSTNSPVWGHRLCDAMHGLRTAHRTNEAHKPQGGKGQRRCRTLPPTDQPRRCSGGVRRRRCRRMMKQRVP